MKMIVIHPEIIGFDNTGVREPRRPLSKSALACLALIPIVALGSWAGGRFTATPVAPQVATIAAPKPAPIAAAEPKRVAPVATEGGIDLQTALDEGLIGADFSGNGREQMKAVLSNKQAQPLTVRVSFGQMFESARSLVVTVRNSQIELPAGACATLDLQTAATRSTNETSPASYRLSHKSAPKLDQLLSYAQDHPELTPRTLQTAVLALTDNLPLSAVCKFTPAGADLKSRFDTTAFRVDTADILAALATLREVGVRDRDVAMTVDPQLKLEAMIEPMLRVRAMRYYGIATDKEWEFWKSELLAGENGTRHYALFGIARFYPEVALDMLPKWAREKRTNSSFRLAAVQALADTRRPEALTILQQLVKELGRNTELGRSASEAAQYLEGELSRPAPAMGGVAFRGTVAAAE